MLITKFNIFCAAACALVAKRYEAILVKGMSFSLMKTSILSTLNKSLEDSKKQNMKLDLLTEVYGDIKMNNNSNQEAIDNFIAWCKKYGLNVVLNLHKAIGNYCDIKEDVELLDDEELQNRFISLWLALEERYANDNSIAFELLNEVRNVDPEKWNILADKTISSIRARNKDRKIIVGSTCWNSPDTLKHLKIYDDENIIYTFHFYSPFEFTHQRGVLQAAPLYYNRIMPYPCDIERYRDYQLVVNNNASSYAKYAKMDITYIRNALQGAVDFAKSHPDKILWCGEFGTIRHADIKWRENWMRDVITILKENDIPYCVWNYLSTPNDGNRFSLVDDDSRKILSEEMARIIKGEI